MNQFSWTRSLKSTLYPVEIGPEQTYTEIEKTQHPMNTGSDLWSGLKKTFWTQLDLDNCVLGHGLVKRPGYFDWVWPDSSLHWIQRNENLILLWCQVSMCICSYNQLICIAGFYKLQFLLLPKKIANSKNPRSFANRLYHVVVCYNSNKI